MKLSERYSQTTDAYEPMEVMLLQGTGCFWKRCTFCDYHLDSSQQETAIKLNDQVLARVTGTFSRLAVLNSGSYFELPKQTQAAVAKLCNEKGIQHLHFESHYQKRHHIAELAQRLPHVTLHPRTGVETFDEDFRENVLKKGMGSCVTPEDIRQYFSEICLLFGIQGQTMAQLSEDIAIARRHFHRVYLNIFNENTTPLKADNALIARFMEEWFEPLSQDPRFCVLVQNTDLGVGER